MAYVMFESVLPYIDAWLEGLIQNQRYYFGSRA